MQKIIAVNLVTIAVLIAGWIAFTGARAAPAEALETFARCLTEKGWTMYGAYWCPHCQNEKEAFAGSFERIAYVECTDEPNRCVAAGIKGFPTWLAADGRRFEGEQGIERLSELSGCAVPTNGAHVLFDNQAKQ